MLTAINKNKYLIKKILIILLVCLCAIQIAWDEAEKYKQRKTRIELSKCNTRKIIFGYITSSSERAKSDLNFLNYKYFINGTEYKDQRRCHFKYDYIKFDSTKFFPIIIDSINPLKNYLLITRKDFELLGIQKPDSLNWLFKYSDY